MSTDATEALGRVLVADDQEVARLVCSDMLRHLGYEVTAVGGGQEAIDRFRADPDAYACVILDLTMPEIGGDVASRAIREIRSEVPILLMSGYDPASVDRPGVKAGVAFLKKPYRMNDLQEALAAAMDR